jgi:SAM-dependent methyltransferase
MSPFDAAPEFVEWDNRQFRPHNPVTQEQMHNKHEVLFPASLVRDKTILDLGCALGTTGHWCLSHGATRYSGVETQNTSAEKARELLEKYHPGESEIIQNSIQTYLEGPSETFDIVSALGVLYVFTDYYSILKNMCARARETVTLECIYPYGFRFREDFMGVQFLNNSDINLADENASLVGRGARISPSGLQFIMKDFGFESKEGQLRPAPITGSTDVYNSMNVRGPRFLMRFTRTGSAHMNLSQDLAGKRTGKRTQWGKYP